MVAPTPGTITATSSSSETTSASGVSDLNSDTGMRITSSISSTPAIVKTTPFLTK